MITETCAQCGAQITAEQPAMLWRNRIVCATCRDFLSTRMEQLEQAKADPVLKALADAVRKERPLETRRLRGSSLESGCIGLGVVVGFVFVLAGSITILLGVANIARDYFSSHRPPPGAAFIYGWIIGSGFSAVWFGTVVWLLTAILARLRRQR